jgi:hypothetical protein
MTWNSCLQHILINGVQTCCWSWKLWILKMCLKQKMFIFVWQREYMIYNFKLWWKYMFIWHTFVNCVWKMQNWNYFSSTQECHMLNVILGKDFHLGLFIMFGPTCYGWPMLSFKENYIPFQVIKVNIFSKFKHFSFVQII